MVSTTFSAPLTHRSWTFLAVEIECAVRNALEKFEDGAEVTAEILCNAGIVKNALDGIKILGNGALTKKLTVKAAAFSASAKEKIEAAGGKAEVI